MIHSARLPLALLPFLAHALARELDRALGLVLRAEVEPAGLVGEVGRALAADAAAALTRISLWLVAWAAATLGLAWWRRKASRADADAEIERPKLVAWPLLLRPALTLLALLSVALAPAYPYAFTLPVALTQDWGIAQDVLALAVLAAALPALRFPAPRAVEVFALGFLAYAALVPEWAWHWDSHPGNEPKTLRQAVALGHWLTFDAEAVSGPMETLGTRPLGASLASGAAVVARESWAMLAAVARGRGRPRRDPRDAHRAPGGPRQGRRRLFRARAGPLAPARAGAARRPRAQPGARRRGPRGGERAALLRARRRARRGALPARARRDGPRRPGGGARLVLLACVPPFLFYFHQFYPGDARGAACWRSRFGPSRCGPSGSGSTPFASEPSWRSCPGCTRSSCRCGECCSRRRSSSAGATHGRSCSAAAAGAWALRVLAPNLASLYLIALYNFAITGSVRPDALFLAWGPGGVTSARLGQGLLGLLLDARYGILPYVPLLVLAAGGLVLGGARRFAPVLPAALVYYLTVASADNWSGAVCNLGPLRHARSCRWPWRSSAIALARTAHRRGAVALALALASWTALVALELRHDPHAANDSWLLLAKSTFADGRAVHAGPVHQELGGRRAGPAGAARRVGAADRGHWRYWLKRAAAESGERRTRRRCACSRASRRRCSSSALRARARDARARARGPLGPAS